MTHFTSFPFATDAPESTDDTTVPLANMQVMKNITEQEFQQQFLGFRCRYFIDDSNHLLMKFTKYKIDFLYQQCISDAMIYKTDAKIVQLYFSITRHFPSKTK